ncbi:MAG TPA: alpha-2-macroglobulin family protein, partial [Fimbriimonadaceae bacterium]|nr:alpha-2-macroglobulin family protein [Fimbriimonadaceae bacterium]
TVYSFSDVYLDGDDKSEVDMQVRRDFRDTAFWQPYVETDDNGKASIEVKLPDNLTSWRATATAVTADARSGKGRTNVVARKPIMVRLSTPAFMVEDERQTVGATVMNETDQRRTIRVRADLTGLEVTGSTSSTLTIDPRSSAKVTWDVTAKAPGEARMLVAAISDGAGMNDALEKTFEVKTNGPTYTSYSAGDTDGQATFEIEVDPNAHSGSVEVSVTPTLLGSIVGSIDGLVRYPYGCVEQTMDRFMPAMVVSRYLHATGISRPDLDEKIADVAKKSQARLRSMQHSDGGFGWWSYDKSDPEMTALVLEGLYQAERAGADVNVEMRDRAIQWSKNFMLNVRPKYLWRDDSLRLAYALSLQGVDPSVWFVALPQKPEEEKDVAMLARTVLAIDVTKGHLPPESKKIHDAAYNRLISLAAVGDATASWEAEWWNEPTAIALQALIKEDPHSDLVTKTLRFLANRRRGRGWWSTRDTAQTVLAGIEYLEAVYQPGANVGVTITGPDGVDHLFQFDSRDPSAEKTLTIPVSSLKKGKNAFKVKVEGQGRVYYSTKLEQSIYDKSPKPEPYGKDLSIKREYFRMESQRLEDGTIRLMPSKEPVTSAKSGEVLHCRLTVTSSMDREFVLIHDPALSNSRFVDRGDVDIYEWRYWWSDQSYFDDHTAVFMRYLQAGDSVIEYTVRAEASGNSFALPATVSLMYQPDIRATTGTTTLEVHQ